MITRNGKVYLARSDAFVKDSLIVIADMRERNFDAARWSHDGKTLGVTDASGNLWLMDPAAKKVRPAANGQPLDQGRSVGPFLFTPDDKAIVFFRRRCVHVRQRHGESCPPIRSRSETRVDVVALGRWAAAHDRRQWS